MMENDKGSFLLPELPLYDKGKDLACVCGPQDEGLPIPAFYLALCF